MNIKKSIQKRIAKFKNKYSYFLGFFEEIKCPICGLFSKGFRYRLKKSKCIFNHEDLVRYECPNCGVIFGNKRMLNLSQELLSKEYEELYANYEEGDSTESELEAFYSLNPKKDGLYLNYGAGNWSNAINIARENGYNLLGYEPYSNNSNSPYIIKDKEELKKYKFDGIFSHNLLEHLQNPIDILLFMKSLLKDDTSIMSHSTPCFQYAYEFTRFHLFFFTGNSLSFICSKIGLDYKNTENPTIKILGIEKGNNPNE